ncbi:AAC-rich mRNA clone AAC4 protein-like [Asterias amurensis]|uniref:AAC-rich mRNA clone AAC4 protein-like n=1 Tax=Asterias amurensis TaxID=7602 RepID=UPI003AB631DD
MEGLIPKTALSEKKNGLRSSSPKEKSVFCKSRPVKRRVRHSRNPSPPVHLYIGVNFAVRLHHNFRFQRHVTNSNERGLIWTEFESFRRLSHMALSECAVRILTVPNAGGNSVESEVLSFELLHRCFGARLLKTEMEVAYFPEGGSITDFTCEMFGTRLGVSVTRAMKFKGVFELEDADKLLRKKLNGIVTSSRNTLEHWSKQILHIWATNHNVAAQIARSYSTMPRHLTSNTVVLVTVVTKDLDRLSIF